MELYIITGASRGLGCAMAEELMAPGRRLLGLSRSPLDHLQAQAATKGCSLEAVAVDLRQPAAAAAALERALAAIDLSSCRLACLINNAGVVDPVGDAAGLAAAEIAAAVAVNLAAPMALGAVFLRQTALPDCRRKMLNITSGAARTAYAGWTVYGATKAGLDHYTRCLAAEEQAKPNGARVAAVAPGIVDTDMQAKIRSLPPGVFRQQQQFVDLHRLGRLTQAPEAAARLIAHLQRDDFGAEPVVDIRHSTV